MITYEMQHCERMSVYVETELADAIAYHRRVWRLRQTKYSELRSRGVSAVMAAKLSSKL